MALCCLWLIYIGNILSLWLRLCLPLWCDFTVVTLIQAHFDLALSCCSVFLPFAVSFSLAAPQWAHSAAFNPNYPPSHPINLPIFPSILPSLHLTGRSVFISVLYLLEASAQILWIVLQRAVDISLLTFYQLQLVWSYEWKMNGKHMVGAPESNRFWLFLTSCTLYLSFWPLQLIWNLMKGCHIINCNIKEGNKS